MRSLSVFMDKCPTTPNTNQLSGWGGHPINFKSWVYSQCIIGMKKIRIKQLLAGAHVVIFVYEVKFNKKKKPVSVVYKQM